MHSTTATEITKNAARRRAEAAAGAALDFDEFYERHSRSLMGLACVLTRNEKEAEDLIQDVFADVHRQWDQVQMCDNPRAWVRKIMTNKSTSRIRRSIVEQKAMTKIASRPLKAPNETIIQSPEILRAIEQLPTRQAQVVVLKYWEDRTVEDIALTLGCGTETVKTHLRRGRAAMAVTLESFKTPGPGNRRSGALPLVA